MKKNWAIFMILLFFVAIPNVSTAFGNFFNKSLCDFPFGQDGTFSAYYDQRNFDPNYYTGSYPNGGIKLELFLGRFGTVKERDRIIKKIYWVRYTNKSVGTTYLVTTPYKFKYLDWPTAEYDVSLGVKAMAIGDWVISVCTRTGTYTGTFKITEDMIDFQSPAEAVDPIVSEDTSTGAIIVEAFPTNGILYRARIFDDEENIVSQQDWLPTWCGSSNSQCTMTFEYQDARGETLCIETRIYNQEWPIMVPNESCKAYDMNPGGMSRSRIYLKLENLKQ